MMPIGQSLNTPVGRDSMYFQHHMTTKQEDYHATVNLSKVLSSKFKKLNNINSSKSAMIYSRLQKEMFVSLNDLAKEENCDEILITRAFVREEKQKKEDEKNQEFFFPQKHSKKRRDTIMDDEAREEKEKKYFLQKRSSLPSINKKYQFDCSQVSPSLADCMGGDLPVRHKKMVSFSSYHIPDASPTNLGKDYDMIKSQSYCTRDVNRIFGKSRHVFGKKVQSLKKDSKNVLNSHPGFKMHLSKIPDREFHFDLKNEAMKMKFKEFLAVRNV